MISYSIAPGVPSDRSDCAMLWMRAVAHRDKQEPSPELQSRALTKLVRPGIFLVLKSPDLTVVGYSMTFLCENRPAHLAQIAIEPAAQGEGLGRALLNRTVADVGRLANAITLRVLADNLAACALYESLGWVAIERGHFEDSGRPNVTYRRSTLGGPAGT
jgi:ribosomal protein S18 acetylase RimI-like enzyme